MFTLTEALGIFGLSNLDGIDDDALKKRYRKLVLINHPDKGGTAEKFDEIVKAYEFLQGYLIDGASRTLWDDLRIKTGSSPFEYFVRKGSTWSAIQVFY